MHYLEIRERVRKMRRNPTLSEKALWQNLKGKKLFGFRFLRQHLIVYQVTDQECFYYVADFYCNRARLVIELDGGIHDKKEQREKDYNRDHIINSLGLRVLRIRNEELFNMPAVLEKIFAALNNL